FRGAFGQEAASILTTNILSIAGFELRYRGVREFLGLPRPRPLSLLPHLVALLVIASFVSERPDIRSAVNYRLTAVHLVLLYIGARTVWVLLRAPAAALSREIRWLAAIASVTAACSLVMLIIVTVDPIGGDVFAAGIAFTWFFLALDGLAVAWSLFSLGLA